MESIEAQIMKLLRERLSIYKNSEGDQLVPNEVIRTLRDELLSVVNTFNAPEKKKSGAYVMTEEASLAESQERQSGERIKNNPKAKPRAV